MPWALAQEAGTKTVLSSRECHGEEATGPAMQVLSTVLQPGHLHLYSQATCTFTARLKGADEVAGGVPRLMPLERIT